MAMVIREVRSIVLVSTLKNKELYEYSSPESDVKPGSIWLTRHAA